MLLFIQKKTIYQEGQKLQLCERVNEFIATKKGPSFSVKSAASLDASGGSSVHSHCLVPAGKPHCHGKVVHLSSAVISLWGSPGGERWERADVLRRVKSLSEVYV